MDLKDLNKSEAEFAGFVDRGTQVVLQDAIGKIVESFSQTDALEDILGYLEEMRETSQNSDERLKESQQKNKQIYDRVTTTETSIKNLLQRIQSMEVQIAEMGERVQSFESSLTKLVTFFEQPAFSRMFSKIQAEEE